MERLLNENFFCGEVIWSFWNGVHIWNTNLEFGFIVDFQEPLEILTLPISTAVNIALVFPRWSFGLKISYIIGSKETLFTEIVSRD